MTDESIADWCVEPEHPPGYELIVTEYAPNYGHYLTMPVGYVKAAETALNPVFSQIFNGEVRARGRAARRRSRGQPDHGNRAGAPHILVGAPPLQAQKELDRTAQASFTASQSHSCPVLIAAKLATGRHFRPQGRL